MTISFSGLASGIDTSSWVESLVALKRAKVTTLEEQKEEVTLSKDTLSNIKSFFATFRSTIQRITDSRFNIVSRDLFAQNIATSANLNILTATATTEAEEGTYKIKVDKIATATKATSKHSFMTTIVETTTATSNSLLKHLGVNAGIIGVKVNGISHGVQIQESDTIATFIEKLKNIGVEADYNEKTGVFSVNLSAGDIQENGTNIIDSLHLDGVNEGYQGDTLTIETPETIFSMATEDTLMKDLGVRVGNVKIEANGTTYTIATTSTTDIGDFVTSLQNKNIDATFANGIFTLEDAEIIDEGGTNIINAMGLTKDIYSKTQETGTLKLATTVVETTIASETTLIKNLGNGLAVSNGDTVIVKNSNNETITITLNANSTIEDLFGDLKAAGLNADINNAGVVEISGGTIIGGTFDIKSAFALQEDPYTAMSTGNPLTETIIEYELVTLQTRLVEDLGVTRGYLEVTDADGNKFYQKIYNGQTISDLMADFANHGIYSRLDERTGILEITGGAFRTMTDDEVNTLIGNHTIAETDANYKRGTNLLECLYGADVIATEQITVASTYSRSRALTRSVTTLTDATLGTTLGTLGLSGNGTAIFDVRGDHRTINVTTSMTIQGLMDALEAQGIESSWDADFSRITINNATISGGNSNLGSVLDLTETISGKYVTSNELYSNKTIIITATEATTLNELGISGNQTVTLYCENGDTHTFTVNGNTTLDGLITLVNNSCTGVTAGLEDGVFKIDGGYIVNSAIESALGLEKTIDSHSNVLGTKVVHTITTSATGTTTLGEIITALGTQSAVSGGYNLNFNDEIINVSATTKLDDIIWQIHQKGGTTSVDHSGRLHIEGGTLTGTVATALGFNSVYTTNSVSATGQTITTINTVVADSTTKLGKLGFGASTITVQNTYNEQVGTITTNADMTIGDMLTALAGYGISGTITNGVITLRSDEDNYATGGVLQSMGIGTDGTTVTTTVGTTNSSSAAVTFTTTKTADSDTKLRDLGVTTDQKIAIKGPDDVNVGTVTVTSTMTIGDVLTALAGYGISGTINAGNIYLDSEIGNYVEDVSGSNLISGKFGISSSVVENYTTTAGTTATSSSIVANTSTADSSTTLGELGITSTTITVQGLNATTVGTITANANMTVGDVLTALAGYGISGTIKDGRVYLDSEIGNYATGDLMTQFGITTSSVNVTTTIKAESASAITIAAKHATSNTKLSDLGKGASTITVLDTYGNTVGTVTTSADMTIGDILTALAGYDISGTIKNGVIALDSDVGNYTTGGVLADWGMATQNAGTITIGKQNYSTKTITATYTGLADGSTKLKELNLAGITYGNIYVKSAQGSTIAIISTSADMTIDELLSQFSANGVNAYIENGVIKFSDENSNYVVDANGCNVLNKLGIGSTTGSTTVSVAGTHTSSAIVSATGYKSPTLETKLNELNTTLTTATYAIDIYDKSGTKVGSVSVAKGDTISAFFDKLNEYGIYGKLETASDGNTKLILESPNGYYAQDAAADGVITKLGFTRTTGTITVASGTTVTSSNKLQYKEVTTSTIFENTTLNLSTTGYVTIPAHGGGTYTHYITNTITTTEVTTVKQTYTVAATDTITVQGTHDALTYYVTTYVTTTEHTTGSTTHYVTTTVDTGEYMTVVTSVTQGTTTTNVVAGTSITVQQIATEDTTFEELGIDLDTLGYELIEFYYSSINTPDDIISKDAFPNGNKTTIGEFINELNSMYFGYIHASIQDGVITIEQLNSSGLCIIGGPLADALGIERKTETITRTEISTTTQTITTESTDTITIQQFATGDTKLTDLGVTVGSTLKGYRANGIAIQGHEYEATASSTLGELMQHLEQEFDINSELVNGVLTITTNNRYVSGTVADALGIRTVTGTTVNFATTTITVDAETTGSVTVQQFATGSTTFAELGITNAADLKFEKVNQLRPGFSSTTTITMTSTNTLNDFMNQARNNSLYDTVSINAGVITIKYGGLNNTVIQGRLLDKLGMSNPSKDTQSKTLVVNKAIEVNTTGEIEVETLTATVSNTYSNTHSNNLVVDKTITVEAAGTITIETLKTTIVTETESTNPPSDTLIYDKTISIEATGTITIPTITTTTTVIPKTKTETHTIISETITGTNTVTHTVVSTFTVDVTTTGTITVSVSDTFTLDVAQVANKTHTIITSVTITTTDTAAMTLGITTTGTLETFTWRTETTTATLTTTGATAIGEIMNTSKTITSTQTISVMSDGTVYTVQVEKDDTVNDVLTALAGLGIYGNITDGKVTFTGDKEAYITFMSDDLKTVLGISGSFTTTTAIPNASTQTTGNYRFSYTNTISTDDTLAELGMASDGVITVSSSSTGDIIINIKTTDTVDDMLTQLASYGIHGSISNGLLTLKKTGDYYIKGLNSALNNVLKLQKTADETTVIYSASNDDSNSLTSSVTTTSTTGDTFKAIGVTNSATVSVVSGGTTYIVTVNPEHTIDDFLTTLAGLGIRGSLDGGILTLTGDKDAYISDMDNTLAGILFFNEDNFKTTVNLTTNKTSSTISETTVNGLSGDDTFAELNLGTTRATMTVVSDGKEYNVTVDSSDTVDDLLIALAGLGIHGHIEDNKLTLQGDNSAYIKSIDNSLKTALGFTADTCFTTTVNTSYTNNDGTVTQSFTNTLTTDDTFADLKMTATGYMTVVSNGTQYTITINTADTVDDLLTSLAGLGVYGTVEGGSITLQGTDNIYIKGMTDNVKNALKLTSNSFYTTSAHTTKDNNNGTITQQYTTTNTLSTDDTFGDLNLGTGTITVVSNGTTTTIAVATGDTVDDILTQLASYGITGNVDNGILTLTGNKDAYILGITDALRTNLKLSTTNYTTTSHTADGTSNTYSITVTATATGTTKLQDLRNPSSNAPSDYKVILTTKSDAGNETNVTLSFNGTDDLYKVIDELVKHGLDASIDSTGRFAVKSSTLTDFDITGGLGTFLMTNNYQKIYDQGSTNNISTQLVQQTVVDIDDDTVLSKLGITNGNITLYKNGVEYTITIDNSKTIGDFRNQLANYAVHSEVINGQLQLIADGVVYTTTPTSGASNLVNVLGIQKANWSLGGYSQESDNLNDTQTIQVIATMGHTIGQLTNSSGTSLGITGGSIYVYQDGTRSTVNINLNDTLEDLASKLSLYGISVGIDSNGKVYFEGDNNSYLAENGTSNILTKLNVNGNWSTRYDSTSKSLGYDVESDKKVNGSTKLVDLQDASGNGLGITIGNYYVYQNGVRTTESITADTTVDDFRATLATYGISTDFDENGSLAVGAYNETYLATAATAGANTNAIDVLFEQWNFTNIYTSNDLEIPTDVTVAISETTKLSDINEGIYQAGYITVVKDGVQTDIELTANDTVGDFINELALYGFEATINGDGQVIIKNTGDSKLQAYTGAGVASNALTLLGLTNWINTNTYESGTISVTTTTVEDVAATRDTRLSKLGVTTGEYYIWKDGVKTTAYISSDETLGSFIDTLKSFGLETSLVNVAGGAKLSIEGSGNSYIQRSASISNASNVVDQLFTGTSNENYEYTGYQETSTIITTSSSATEDTLLSRYDKTALSLTAQGSLDVVVDGVESSIEITADETIGSLLNKFRALGLEATINDGVILIQDGYKTFTIKNTGSSDLVETVGLVYNDDLGGYSASSVVTEQTTESIEEVNLSVSNYAAKNTQMKLLNITNGSLTIYRDGQKATVSVLADETFGELEDRIQDVFGDVEITFNNGYLTFSSVNPGVNIDVGSTTDTSNFSAITGITSDGNGNVKSARELYCVNESSTIITSGMFRDGNVTEGTFKIGDAEFTIDNTTTLSSLISQINSSEKSNAIAFWDTVDGRFVITSRTTGAALVNIEAGTSNFTDIMGLTESTWKASGNIDVTKMKVDAQEVGDNARFSINGTYYTSTSNNVTSDVSKIKGVTINLKAVSEGEEVELKIERDKETVATAVSDIVDAYNELIENIDKEIAKEAPLHDQSTLKLLRNQIRSIMTGSIVGTNLYKKLSAVGISLDEAVAGNINTDRIDVLNFNKNTFIEKFENDRFAVRNLLVGTDTYDGIFTQVEKVVSQSLEGGYFTSAEKAFNNQISRIDKKIKRANEEVGRYRARLEAKFASMDLLISKMQNQFSSFLGT